MHRLYYRDCWHRTLTVLADPCTHYAQEKGTAVIPSVLLGRWFTLSRIDQDPPLLDTMCPGTKASVELKAVTRPTRLRYLPKKRRYTCWEKRDTGGDCYLFALDCPRLAWTPRCHYNYY